MNNMAVSQGGIRRSTEVPAGASEAAVPVGTTPRSPFAEPAAQVRVCPYCGGMIAAAALACRHCERDVRSVRSATGLDPTSRGALYDPLTGLPNHPLLVDRLGCALAVARREGGVVGVVRVVIEGLEAIHASHGRPTADGVLRAMSERLHDALRGEDTLSRQPGSEFVIVVRASDEEGVHVVAKRVLECARRPFNVGGQDLRLRVSLGTAAYPGAGGTAEHLLRNSRTALERYRSGADWSYDVYTQVV